MGCLHNAREAFYDKLRNLDLQPEIKKVVNEYREESGLFELCKLFADIALNAPKAIIDGTQSVQGFFQLDDMEKAKNATIVYVKEHQIENAEELLLIIKEMHKHAVEWDDERGKPVKINAESKAINSGYHGMLHNFKKLPVNVFDEISSDILDELKKECE